MKNGYDEKLAEKFSGFGINQYDRSDPSFNNNDNLYQVLKAVETAETTIQQQEEENNWLRSELQRKTQELKKYNHDESVDQRSHHVAPWNELGHGSYESCQSVPSQARNNAENQALNSKINGTLRAHPNDHLTTDDTGPSQLSSPSTRSISPTRHVVQGDYEVRPSSSGQRLLPMAEMNNSSSQWKQVQEHEEEIMKLRKHLADYSIREARICNEKYVLEERIAYMRLAFDQQQQDLVDAASKALSYRQDIIEENIRLTYALQDAQQERSTFIQSLLPLLAEYSLQPPLPDAQSIVSNVKVLFKHLQEKLIRTESKLKESQYQLVSWHSDMNHANFSSQSSSHSIGAQLSAVSVSGQTGTEWDVLGGQQSGLDGGVVNNANPDGLRIFSPLESRNSSSPGIVSQGVINHGDSHPTRYGDEMSNKQVTFRDPVSSSEMDDPYGNGNPNETNTEDPSSSYPYLPPVYEEPSSSFSEDDDLLPAIEGLQISGEAVPGKELQACGFSINGTTSCNFEWIRHLEDGSVNYIDGAKQPNYLLTADDINTYLAIEVQPLDDRKRKGELVKVYANDNKKITCDPEMQSCIERTLNSGHASYKVSLSSGYLDIWEPATLAIKKEGYSIKCSGPSGVVVSEKFSPSISVIIPYGHVSEFILICSNGVQHLLRAENGSADVSGSRDTIVLTLRLFIIKAGEKKRGKKKGLFFHK